VAGVVAMAVEVCLERHVDGFASTSYSASSRAIEMAGPPG
jgi:hypothetical protein